MFKSNSTSKLENKEIDINNVKKDHKEFIKNNKLILKTQQRFKSKRHNVFIKKDNKIGVSSNDGERIQSIYLIKTCIRNEQRSSK